MQMYTAPKAIPHYPSYSSNNNVGRRKKTITTYEEDEFNENKATEAYLLQQHEEKKKIKSNTSTSSKYKQLLKENHQLMRMIALQQNPYMAIPENLAESYAANRFSANNNGIPNSSMVNNASLNTLMNGGLVATEDQLIAADLACSIEPQLKAKGIALPLIHLLKEADVDSLKLEGESEYKLKILLRLLEKDKDIMSYVLYQQSLVKKAECYAEIAHRTSPSLAPNGSTTLNTTTTAAAQSPNVGSSQGAIVSGSSTALNQQSTYTSQSLTVYPPTDNMANNSSIVTLDSCASTLEFTKKLQVLQSEVKDVQTRTQSLESKSEDTENKIATIQKSQSTTNEILEFLRSEAIRKRNAKQSRYDSTDELTWLDQHQHIDSQDSPSREPKHKGKKRSSKDESHSSGLCIQDGVSKSPISCTKKGDLNRDSSIKSPEPNSENRIPSKNVCSSSNKEDSDDIDKVIQNVFADIP